MSSKENDLMSDQVPSYNSKMGQHQEIYHFQFFLGPPYFIEVSTLKLGIKSTKYIPAYYEINYQIKLVFSVKKGI